MTSDLAERVINRLTATNAAEALSFVVLAAIEGQKQLDSYLDDGLKVPVPDVTPTQENGPKPEPPGVYLASITVEGFRGIGPPTTLQLRPGPGLTLVVGRNGSGKSSFAEGIEFLLTGRNYRWEKRPKVWEGGWKNLHRPAKTLLKADLVVEGRGRMMVCRTWATDDIAAGAATAQQPGQTAVPLDSLGWHNALVAFRPFLSYNELGSLLDEGPSRLYDALSSVLGLEDVGNVQTILTSARKERLRRTDEAKQGAQVLRDMVATLRLRSTDERLTAVEQALTRRNWDLEVLEVLVRSGQAKPDSEVAILQRLASLPPVDTEGIATVVGRLRAAERESAGFAGTNAERSRERARLLQLAVAFHEKHDATDGAASRAPSYASGSRECPVCGTENALGEGWLAATRLEIKALEQEASACLAADASRQARVREAQKFLAPAPTVLAQAGTLGLKSLPEARNVWAKWTALRDVQEAGGLADGLENHASELARVLGALIEEAEAEARRREDVWAPLATAVAEWLPKARIARRAATTIDDLKQAESWWKEASAVWRDERFAPVANRAMAVWKRLRLQSNVDLGGIGLEGVAQRRRVSLNVTVDGTPAEALGVMSQGELHGLALSLFLPRATLPESPFRFIAIDDPVQSMDPARVEGLARVLADAASTRQVIVFTHDDRLRESVRRLGIEASVIEVTRRANSVVEVRAGMDPVEGHLDDAHAVAKTADLPDKVSARIVPGFCRLAIEAACMEVVRRRRLGRGEPHDQVEELLTKNGKTHPLLALALFDDEKRTSDVLARLEKIAKGAADTLQACKEGSHQAHAGDLVDLVKSTGRLTDQLVGQK